MPEKMCFSIHSNDIVFFFFSFTSKWERPSPKRMMQCVADPSDSHTIFFSNVSGCSQKFVLRILCKGHSCNRCSVVILLVWHGQCSDWPILNLMYIWFNRLCPVRSLLHCLKMGFCDEQKKSEIRLKSELSLPCVMQIFDVQNAVCGVI